MAAEDFDFLANRNEIIAAAFRKIGVLSFGQELRSDQANEGAFGLNLVLQDWQNKNVFLWSKQRLTTALVATQASYTPTDPSIIGIERASLLRISNGSEHELEILGFYDFQGIINKTETGDPKIVNFSFGQSSSIKVWPVPTAATVATYTLVYTGISKLKDWDNSNGFGDLPSRYQMALVYELAVYLASDHAVPMGERDRLKLLADDAFRAAKRKDDSRSTLEVVQGAFMNDRSWN